MKRITYSFFVAILLFSCGKKTEVVEESTEEIKPVVFQNKSDLANPGDTLHIGGLDIIIEKASTREPEGQNQMSAMAGVEKQEGLLVSVKIINKTDKEVEIPYMEAVKVEKKTNSPGFTHKMGQKASNARIGGKMLLSEVKDGAKVVRTVLAKKEVTGTYYMHATAGITAVYFWYDPDEELGEDLELARQMMRARGGIATIIPKDAEVEKVGMDISKLLEAEKEEEMP